MRLWLSRQANNQFMFSELPPIREPVHGSNPPVDDLYITPGDSSGSRNHCRGFAERICPGAALLKRLDSVQVEMPEWTIHNPQGEHS